jgi:hypothetical protein
MIAEYSESEFTKISRPTLSLVTTGGEFRRIRVDGVTF